MSQTKEICLVQINDTHAYFELHPELFWAGDRAAYRPAGGYARLAALLNQIRAEQQGQVLALDCGDTIHGTYAAVQTEGAALVPILRQLDLAAWTGHWEFAYGPRRLQEIAAQLPYPFLASNCYVKETEQLLFQPFVIHEVGGVRVGVIGLAAYIVDKMMPTSFSEGVTMRLGDEELLGYIHRLRHEERADLVVLISHLGFPQDMQLAREVDGIDVLLSAHTHNRIWAPARVNNTLVMQSGSQGSFLGRLQLQIEEGAIVGFKHRLLVVDEEIEPEPQMEAIVDEVLAPYRWFLSQVVGETATALSRDRVLECTMDNFLLQALLHAHRAELAFSHGWRYGAPVPPGPVTMNDLYNMVPMNPSLFSCDISGDELWTMLEENLEHVFSRFPYRQMGGYVKRCLGLNAYMKVENPAGRRLQELFIRGQKVRPDRLYSAVFITTQAVPPRFGSNRQQLPLHAVEALQRYLQAESPVAADLRDTFVAV